MIHIPELINRFNENLVIIIPCLIAVLILIYTLIAFKHFKGKTRKKSKMTQLKKWNRTKAEGVIFGKYKLKKLVCSPTDAEGHIAVFGGSGLGKTSALLIPTLQKWLGTSFTIDISGDISKNVDMPNKLIYEPADPNSLPYNIFGAVDELEDEDDMNEALEQLAFLLMPDSTKGNDTTEFFTSEGRKILTAALIALYHEKMDFIEICEIVVRNSWQELFNLIDKTKNINAIQYINSFQGANEKNTAGCKQTVDKVLKLFATNERIKKSIRRPKENERCFTPKELEKSNVFVIVDDAKLKLYAPILHIITSQSLEFFSCRPNNAKPNILFCLDEFASFGKMDITQALRKLRKKNVRIMVLTQSMADMDLIYGKDERMAMMNNFKFKVILGADDTDTQEYFSKLIGHREITKYSKSRNANNVTTSESQTKERIIEPETLGHLGKKLVLMHPDGYVMLKKNFYYK